MIDTRHSIHALDPQPDTLVGIVTIQLYVHRRRIAVPYQAEVHVRLSDVEAFRDETGRTPEGTPQERGEVLTGVNQYGDVTHVPTSCAEREEQNIGIGEAKLA